MDGTDEECAADAGRSLRSRKSGHGETMADVVGPSASFPDLSRSSAVVMATFIIVPSWIMTQLHRVRRRRITAITKCSLILGADSLSRSSAVAQPRRLQRPRERRNNRRLGNEQAVP